MRSGGPAVRPGAASPPGPRFAYLDGIRALAALFVLVHHSWLAVFPAFPRNSGPWWLGWMLYGHLAVSVFIVVSGFSLTIAPARRGMHLPGSSRQFLARRAWRILPTYWAALAFTCLVYGVVTAHQTGASVNPKAIAVHALLLQDVVNSTKPNGAFWSIAVEWQIYFLFPAMLLLCRRFGARSAVGGIAVMVVVGYELATHVALFERFLNITPQYIVLFAMGVLAASLLGRESPPRFAGALAPVAALLALAFVALCWAAGSVWIASHFFWVDLLVGAAVAALIAALAMERTPGVAALLGSRTLAGVGAYSYSIYLIHAPLLWLVWHYLVSPLDLAPVARLGVLLVVVTPVALVASWAFYRAFERPFLKRRSWAAWGASLRGVAPRAPVPPAPLPAAPDRAPIQP
jgi:peptidoglycan/LPS O-acetylase OafA/YrhL